MVAIKDGLLEELRDLRLCKPGPENMALPLTVHYTSIKWAQYSIQSSSSFVLHYGPEKPHLLQCSMIYIQE